jgi:membrane-bound lytic murein transglycosylase A
VLLAALAALVQACGTAPAPGVPIVERACKPVECAACPVCPSLPQPKPAPQKPLQPARWADLPGWSADDPAQAWPAILQSCRPLAKQAMWKPVCDAFERLGPGAEAGAIRRVLEQQLRPWRVVEPEGREEGLVTGYYEPLIRAGRQRSATYAWPVYGVPDDLLSIDLAGLYPELGKLRLRGRLVGNKVVPYWSRAEVESMGERLPARVLFWAADPIELFFLQVQGSGRVELPDGSVARIGYADQNGHPYQSIGRWLVENGELALAQASMEGIKNWARAHPARLAELLNANPSYVFFRELGAVSGGPPGALGVPLTAGRSIAVDPRTIPLGAPVFLSTTLPLSDRPLQRLVVAQDTGGAIKGAVRADLFWGFGPEAAVQAGRMKQAGRMWVLMPNAFAPDPTP